MSRRWLNLRAGFALALLWALASQAYGAQSIDASTQLRAIADEVYAWRLEREPQMRLVKGMPVTRLPRVDEESAREAAEFARRMQARTAAIDAGALRHADELFRQSLNHWLVVTVDAERYYWLVFVVTPYQGGDIHQMVFQALAAQEIATPEQGRAYLRLVGEYVDIVSDMRQKTLKQRARGLLVPAVAIDSAVELVRQIRTVAPDRLKLSDARLSKLPAADAQRLRSDLSTLLERKLLPELDRLVGVFDTDYRAAAPRTVGLRQYPDGEAFYRHLIRSYTGVDMTATELHEIGRSSLVDIDRQLARIRTQLGFKGTRAQFHDHLKTDPRWLAKTPGDVEARYMEYVGRIEPRIPEFFSVLPKAPYGVKRLDPAAEPGMTYGYYQRPNAADASGYYRYNGSGLERRTLVGAQHLIYHELIPGHHFQIALEQERADAHPLRAFMASTVYAEGWAEYAAGLAEEMDLYEPYDRYGHLMMRSFVATRLVVDTGLNALGWTLDQARDAMRAGTLESDVQIASELLRYSTDIPGQALAYYLGYDRIQAWRARAERELGEKFDLRAFNDAVLSAGSVPLDVLESHIEWFIGEQRGRSTAGGDEPTQHIAAVDTAAVRIDKAALAVWSALFDRSGWMNSFVARRHLAGPANATGDVSLNELQSAGGDPGRRLEEVLLAQPPTRLVIRLAPESGASTYAIGDYRLTASGRATNVEFTVYWWEDVPASAPAQQLENEYSGHTRAKIQADLERLKRFVETGRKATAE